MKNSVSINELRTNLSQLIGRVMYGNDRVVIKKYNRDAAILLNLGEYERLVDPTKRFSKEEWASKFRFIDKIKIRISKADQNILQTEIEKAVKEVRATKK